MAKTKTPAANVSQIIDRAVSLFPLGFHDAVDEVWDAIEALGVDRDVPNLTYRTTKLPGWQVDLILEVVETNLEGRI